MSEVGRVDGSSATGATRPTHAASRATRLVGDGAGVVASETPGARLTNLAEQGQTTKQAMGQLVDVLERGSFVESLCRLNQSQAETYMIACLATAGSSLALV